MNPVEWAEKKIVFDQATHLVGKFDIEKYRFMRKPLLEIDNIHTKRLTIYKASSAGGTVFLQIALSFWLDQRPGGIQCAMQSDEACDEWVKTRGKKWFSRIPSLMDSMSNDKYAITNSLYLWPHSFLLLSGPGLNAQQAKQVRYFVSDESHTDAFKPGALAAFEERMGKRWQRQGLHISTAADAGKEIDQFYNMGGQNEFHLCCPKCNGLVWPLWEEKSLEEYNGHKIFQFKDGDVSPKFVCPFCMAEYHDTARDRRALHEGSDYVCKNPTHDKQNQSYRWNCFSAWFMEWSDHLSKYRQAIEAAKIGDLAPHEDWIKKRLCLAYTPTLPDLGEGRGIENYSLGEKWEFLPNGEPVGETVLIQTGDYQAGKKGEGSHVWALITQWDRLGNSRRIAWQRCDTWAQFRALQLQYGVAHKNVFVDCGYDDRTVFYQCSLHRWYATRGSDLQQYHTITIDKGTKRERKVTFPMPYSQPERQNGNVGAKQPDRLRVNLSGALPKGWCLARVMCNPQLYGYLHALQAGAAGRYFGIARDMPETYTKGFPAFIPVVEKNKKTNVESVIWKKVKAIDHPWDCEVQALMAAMVSGYYPTATKQPEENETSIALPN